MSQHRKHRGRASEHIVAAYLRENGWPYAEPVGASRRGSDVTGTPGIDWEVKARTRLELPALIRQLGAREAENVLGIGVLRLNGQGPASIDSWPAVIRLEDLVHLLHGNGYGDAL